MPLTGWEWAAAAAAWFGYLGLLIAVGGVIFIAFVHDGRADERRPLIAVIVAAAVLAALARVAAEPVRVIQLSGQGVQAITDARIYGVTLRMADGWAGLVRLVGLSLLLVGIVRPGSRRRMAVATAGALLALVSASLSGHTVTARPQWLVWPSDVAHVLAGAVWFGGLVLLAVVLRRRWGRTDAVDGAGLVARFSGVATIALVLVLTSGVAMAWAEVRQVDELFGSSYGAVLLVKVALVLAIAAVGVYNNRRLVPAIRRSSCAGSDGDDGSRAWHRLGVTVRAEAVGLVVVLAITGMLVHVEPPRPEASGVPHAPTALDAAHHASMMDATP